MYDFEETNTICKNNQQLLENIDFIFHYLQQQYCIKNNLKAPKLSFFYYKFDDLPENYLDFYLNSIKRKELNKIFQEYFKDSRKSPSPFTLKIY